MVSGLLTFLNYLILGELMFLSVRQVRVKSALLQQSSKSEKLTEQSWRKLKAVLYFKTKFSTF